MLEFRFNDMINDGSLSAIDRQWVLSFQAAVDEFLAKRGGYTTELSMFTIASSIGLDVTALHKDGALLYALWLTMMHSLQKYITANDFKYADIDEFLAAYPGLYRNESDYEKRYLWLSANYMNILFRMVTPRKNKGLVLFVVPKLIEGWDAKYVTGSGQTKATANRVHIFETEGNVTANQRGRAKGKKRTAPPAEEGQAVPKVMGPPKPKRRRSDPVLTDNTSFAFVPPFGSVAQYRETRQAGAPMPLRSRRSEGSTDREEDLNVNGELKNTFEAWQEATENFGWGLLNLSRDSSFMGTGLAKDAEQQLTDPLDYERGFSWTEIPAEPAPLASANGASINTPSALPVSSLFPQSQSDPSALFPTSSVPAEAAWEVGTVVPTSSLDDIFKGYK